MHAAALEKPAPSGAIDADRLRECMLVRIAAAEDGLAKAELAADLAPWVSHRLTVGQWRALIDGELAALAQDGLARISAGRIEASEAGIARARAFVRPKAPAAPLGRWEALRDGPLLAKALGLQREPARRIAALARPDGLRAAIVQRAFGLRIKGAPTPSRLRSALAAVALERAFGNQIKAGLAGKLGLSAKAGRLLAAQLLGRPRPVGTDARLVAALAAEEVGAAQADLASLRLAVMRRYLEAPAAKVPAAQRARPAPVEASPPARPRLVEPPAPAPAAPVAVRPDLAGFAAEVRRHAEARAHGWPGNRRAYISHVWQQLRQARPEWGLSEIEFKCMLTEAHRAGSLSLANADLKDGSSIRDLQDSAVAYKNAVFHFVRVDG